MKQYLTFKIVEHLHNTFSTLLFSQIMNGFIEFQNFVIKIGISVNAVCIIVFLPNTGNSKLPNYNEFFSILWFLR